MASCVLNEGVARKCAFPVSVMLYVPPDQMPVKLQVITFQPPIQYCSILVGFLK